MKLPNLSHMMKVGQLRYIQSIYEAPQYRNPDTLVRHFIPALQRWGCDLRGWTQIAKLRSQPFYYYVLARTQYYDAVFVDAIRDQTRYIINVGCGSDTRAYRFAPVLKQNGVRVVECDQPKAILAKQRLAGRQFPVDHVDYVPIDLNDASWPDFALWLKEHRDAITIVLMEGVSPYVNDDAFGKFLGLLAAELRPGSRVAYDFKRRGFAKDFGRSERTRNPFRLSDVHEEIAAYHDGLGYHIEHVEMSDALSRRLLPDLEDSGAPLFLEDGILRLLLPAIPSHF